MSNLPLVVYVPGLMPKPEPAVHRDALLRCLIAGLRHYDDRIALDFAANLHCFEIIAWTFAFYGEHRDFSLDADAVETVIDKPMASRQDMAEASAWSRRWARRVFAVADVLPFMIPHIANERQEVHLRDLRKYLQNRGGVAEDVREMLKAPLRKAAAAHRPILLIGHSMGSVIAYESLWQLTHEGDDAVSINLFVSMGSPLGQRFMQKRMLGAGQAGSGRFPGNIAEWVNVTAIGDLTAVDPTLADDYAAMVDFGLTRRISDYSLHNPFRLNGELNAHAEYGYLANVVTARIIADWWQSVR
jgi:surfactin synthase thioesterase subunit